MGMPEGSHASEPGHDVSEQLQALGLTIPESFLVRADEVIE